MIGRRTFLQSIPTVFLPLVAGGRSVAASVGVDYVRATDYASLQAAADVAAGIGSKKLYIPAGVYGDQPQTATDDIKIFGDGPEKTTIQLPDAPAVATYGIRLLGKRQSVSGLSIKGGALGTGAVYGISCTFGCSEWHLSDIRVSGLNGPGAAGASCFDFYQPSATNSGYSNGLGERLTAENSPNATGFIVNAQGNTFRDCVAVLCGNASQKHGFYVQGGANRFEACRAERNSGYNWHNYAAVPERQASYNVYQGCVSISPTFGHFVASSINGADGIPLNRGVSLLGCTFRGAGAGCYNGVGGSVPLLISGCTFEDVLSGAGAWVGVGAGGRVQGCLFRQTTMPANQNCIGVVCAGGAVVSGNSVLNWLAGTAIRADGLSFIDGNSLDLYGGIGLYVNGADVQRGINPTQVHGSAKALYGTTV